MIQKSVSETGNGIIETGNGILSPAYRSPIQKLLNKILSTPFKDSETSFDSTVFLFYLYSIKTMSEPNASS